MEICSALLVVQLILNYFLMMITGQSLEMLKVLMLQTAMITLSSLLLTFLSNSQFHKSHNTLLSFLVVSGPLLSVQPLLLKNSTSSILVSGLILWSLFFMTLASKLAPKLTKFSNYMVYSLFISIRCLFHYNPPASSTASTSIPKSNPSTPSTHSLNLFSHCP